jgi:imidazolonepropionase-like amidohydrolase
MVRKIIKGCNVFDSIEKRVLEKVNVVIAGDRIESVSSAPIDSSEVDQVIDADGCTVIPGLINLHVHLYRRHMRFIEGKEALFRHSSWARRDLPNTQRLLWALKNAWVELLKDGVTTLRSVGSTDRVDIELRNALNEGMFKGPRIIASGLTLAMTGGHGTRGFQRGGMEVDGVDEMRKAVRANLKAGADWIKLCVSGGGAGIHMGDHPSIVEFSEEEIRTAVEEAHKRHKKVTVHGMAAESVKMAVRAGVDCIEHGKLLDDEAINMMKQEGVFFVPTMSASHDTIERERAAGNEKIADMLEKLNSRHKPNVFKCFEAGILVGTGTDTLGHMHEEIELFADCGISRSEALAAATINAARILGLEKEIGSIEEGKKADLVVVDGNPVEDLSALRKIRGVITSGEVAGGDLLINAEMDTINREDLGMSSTLKEYAVNTPDAASDS